MNQIVTSKLLCYKTCYAQVRLALFASVRLEPSFPGLPTQQGFTVTLSFYSFLQVSQPGPIYIHSQGFS